MFRRTGASTFELWLDGALQSTSSTGIALTSSSTTKAVGNWRPTTGQPDEPSRCTISDLVVVTGAALTWQEAKSVLDQRSFPAGVSAAIDFPSAGIDNGDVALVEAKG